MHSSTFWLLWMVMQTIIRILIRRCMKNPMTSFSNQAYFSFRVFHIGLIFRTRLVQKMLTDHGMEETGCLLDFPLFFYEPMPIGRINSQFDWSGATGCSIYLCGDKIKG